MLLWSRVNALRRFSWFSAALQVQLCFVAGCGVAFGRRWQFDPGTSGFRETNGNGLLGRTSAVFTLTNIANHLSDKFPSLSACRFSLARILACTLDSCFLRHGKDVLEESLFVPVSAVLVHTVQLHQRSST